MRHSPFSGAYDVFLDVLVKARKDAGLTQVELADKLGKPQPFVSKYERGERRLDVIEFISISRALGLDPKDAFAQLIKKLPKTIDI